VLRLGVALLGLRLTLAQIAALGWKPVVLVLVVVVVVTVTIALSVLVAWALGFNRLFGLLTGGAGAGGSLAQPSAKGKGGAVYRDRRVGLVDRGDDRLSDAGQAV
jgi:Na+/glutamate symporter